MTVGKRVFDVLLALVLSVLLLVPAGMIAVWILVSDGRPIFHRSERMRSPSRAFQLWKFRTMRVVAQDSGVSGGDKAARITPTGRVLRRSRLDEIPQLWNVLVGDMSFVGPRPPLRRYVERFPALYSRVLQSRPGSRAWLRCIFTVTKNVCWPLARQLQKPRACMSGAASREKRSLI